MNIQITNPLPFVPSEVMPLFKDKPLGEFAEMDMKKAILLMVLNMDVEMMPESNVNGNVTTLVLRLTQGGGVL